MRLRILHFGQWLLRSPRLGAVVFMAAALCVQMSAQDKFEAQPNTIAVSPAYSSVKTFLVLTAKKPVKQAALQWMSNDVTNVELVKLPSQDAGAGGVVVWSAKVDYLPAMRVPGTVIFHVEYVSENVAQHAFATLALSSQQDSASKAVDATIEGNFDAVSEQRPGTAYLVITNNLDVPVHFHFGVEIPTRVFKQPMLNDMDVPPRSSMNQKIELKVDKQTTPGAYPLSFSVEATWQRAGHEEQRRLVVSKTATAGVFFESDLLKLLGVPSFLVLPGCLALFTIQLMLTLGVFGVKNDSKLPQLTITSPGFWILAVSFSGIFAVIYSSLTGTNYLLRYGLLDLRNVWLWSVLVGAAIYCLYAVLTFRRRRLRVPTANDDPITLLKKMGCNKVEVQTSRVKFKIGSVEFTGHVVERIEDGAPLLWVAPKISIVWSDKPEGGEAEKELGAALNESKSAEMVAEILKRAVRNKAAVSVRWSAARTSIPHPYHLKMEDVMEYIAPEKIFEI